MWSDLITRRLRSILLPESSTKKMNTKVQYSEILAQLQQLRYQPYTTLAEIKNHLGFLRKNSAMLVMCHV